MWEQLLAGLVKGMGTGQSGQTAPGMAPNNPQQQTGGQGGITDIVMNLLSQSQPKSGAVGLPQQQNQMQGFGSDMVSGQGQASGFGLLPPPAGGNPQNDPGGLMGNGPLIDLPPLGGPAPQQQQQQQQEVLPVQSQPMGGTPQSMQPGLQQAQGEGPNWANMLNMTGTGTNPNAFTRMGVGYNQGGLMGALGYLLTDLSEKNNQPQQGGIY